MAFLLALVLAGAARAETRTVPVLMYHMVGESGDPDCTQKGSCERRADHCPFPGGGVASPGMVVPLDEFRAEMEYLRDHDYDLISLDELVDPRRPSGEKDVVVTFDDGYADNYDAFRELEAVKTRPHHKGQEFHATLFMVSNNVDCQGRMSAAQLKQMDAAGFRIEDHSRTHDASRTAGSEEQQTEEYGKSKEALEALLGRTVNFAAYPYGSYNEHTAGVMRALGYKAAFPIGNRPADLSGDPYLLNRFAVTGREDFLRALGLKPL